MTSAAARARYLAPEGDISELLALEQALADEIREEVRAEALEGLDWDRCFQCGTELNRDGKMVRGSMWRSWRGLSLAVLCHPCGGDDER